MVVGIPGLLIALIVRFTLKEPIRGMSENRAVSDDPAVPFGQVFEVYFGAACRFGTWHSERL